MAKEFSPIDISNLPDLVRLAEEVAATNTPRILKRHSEDLAILMPVGAKPRHRPKPAKTKADLEAFRSAAGGWKDVDTDRLLADIYADRRVSDRAPVEL